MYETSSISASPPDDYSPDGTHAALDSHVAAGLGLYVADDASANRLPQIDAGCEDLPEVSRQALAALLQANEPPVLFRFGTKLARIETDDGGMPFIRDVDAHMMRYSLARAANWHKVQRDGRSNVTRQAKAMPPFAVVRDVLATPDPPLPVLTRIIEAPVFASDGTLQTHAGYCPASKTFFAPAPGFELSTVYPSPTAAENQEAADLLSIELLGDFPFCGEAEKAHAIAALLTPFVRELIDGPTPLYLVDAPCPGTGKTLLVDVITLPALGRPATAMTEGRDEDEWRKRLFAKLHSAPSTVFIDNVRRKMDSAALSSAITAYPTWEDRLLGKSEIIRVPVRCTWLATGNNIGLSSELARRSIRIRLDSKQDRPWLRSGFRHPELLSWAKDNRGRIVWAALTLIQAWLTAGKPQGKQTLGMFECWAQTIGGVLEVAGIPGFLANAAEFYETSDSEGQQWHSFLASWLEKHGHEEVKVADLLAMASDYAMDLGDKGDQSRKIRLGQRIAEARDRVFSIDLNAQERISLRVEQAGEFRRSMLWRLKSVSV